MLVCAWEMIGAGIFGAGITFALIVTLAVLNSDLDRD